MATVNALANFTSLSDSNLNLKADKILKNMTNNQNFKQPIPTISELQASVLSYKTALLEASSKDTNKVAVKNAKRKELIFNLKKMANYVNAEALNNREKIVSSGYDVTSEEPANTNLGLLRDFSITPTATVGQVESKCKPVENALNYIHQYSMEDPSALTVWTSFTESVSKYMFKNMISGQRYYFRLVVLGRSGQSKESPVVSMFVP